MSEQAEGIRASARVGRLDWPSRDELDEARRRLYDAITGGPRSASRTSPMFNEDGRLYGPFNAMLLDPEVGEPFQELGAALRYRSTLADRTREVAILEVAASLKSDFEWFAHAAIAKNLGVSEEGLAAIRDGVDTTELSEEERLARRLVRALLVRHDLDDVEYAAAEAIFPPVGIADLVYLTGFYTAIATSLAVFRVPLPPGATATF